MEAWERIFLAPSHDGHQQDILCDGRKLKHVQLEVRRNPYWNKACHCDSYFWFIKCWAASRLVSALWLARLVHRLVTVPRPWMRAITKQCSVAIANTFDALFAAIKVNKRLAAKANPQVGLALHQLNSHLPIKIG